MRHVLFYRGVGLMIIGLGALLVLAATPPKPVSYACYAASAPLVIDGFYYEKNWQAVHAVELTDIVTGAAPKFHTSVKALWDATYLYLFFLVDDTNVWAQITERDVPARPDFKAYTENFLKVYLDPDGDGRNYTEMHFSPSGSLNDKWQALPWGKTARRNLGLPLEACADPHWEWNCAGLKYAVMIHGTLNNSRDLDQGWSAEIAIPFAALKKFAGTQPCPPANNDRWKIHLGRRYQVSPRAEAEYWTWPVVGERDCHRPDTWGSLVFIKPDAD